MVIYSIICPVFQVVQVVILKESTTAAEMDITLAALMVYRLELPLQMAKGSIHTLLAQPALATPGKVAVGQFREGSGQGVGQTGGGRGRILAAAACANIPIFLVQNVPRCCQLA